MRISLPYGEEELSVDIPENRLQGVLTSDLHHYRPTATPQELIEESLRNPIGSPPLCKLAEGKQKVVLIASDHTRPVPSQLIIPPMLREIRKGNPHADITILIATGCHRATTQEELVTKFGKELAQQEKIVIHDCDDPFQVVLGTLPSGGELIINKLAAEADLLLAEGFIEPHFFAGFSGSRKSVLPGISSRATVLANHCSEFISNPRSRTGILDGNPIHTDMIWAAKRAKLAFIVNVVINSQKEVIYSVAGDMEAAHKVGCEFVSSLCKVRGKPADIVISTNGGYPMDQNIYQAVKGMTAAEATVKQGGVIIMLAKSNDGHGGNHFFHQLADEFDIDKTLSVFLGRSRGETVPDQWQSQILIRVLQHATVVYLSDAPDEMVRSLHMIPAHSLEDAMKIALSMVATKDPTITVIPDGVSVIVST